MGQVKARLWPCGPICNKALSGAEAPGKLALTSSSKVGSRGQSFLHRFAVALRRYDRKRTVRRLARQIGKDQLSSSLYEPYRRSRGEKTRGSDFEIYAAHGHALSGPEIDVDEKSIPLARKNTDVAVGKPAALRAINRLAV